MKQVSRNNTLKTRCKIKIFLVKVEVWTKECFGGILDLLTYNGMLEFLFSRIAFVSIHKNSIIDFEVTSPMICIRRRIDVFVKGYYQWMVCVRNLFFHRLLLLN